MQHAIVHLSMLFFLERFKRPLGRHNTYQFKSSLLILEILTATWDFWNQSWQFWKILRFFNEKAKTLFHFLKIALQNFGNLGRTSTSGNLCTLKNDESFFRDQGERCWCEKILVVAKPKDAKLHISEIWVFMQKQPFLEFSPFQSATMLQIKQQQATDILIVLCLFESNFSRFLLCWLWKYYDILQH